MNEGEIKKDPRHLSRILATQYLFTEHKKKTSEISIEPFEPHFLLHELEEKKYDTRLYEQIIDGVEKNLEEIDNLIQTKAKDWPLDKINPIDLIILRIAIWEGFINKSVPAKVAINEAIEVEKALNSTTGGSFINGVLGNLLEIDEKS